MRTLAVLPVRSFSSAKQRLSGTLAAGARQSLVQAMFADVLGALRRARRLDAIAVVTDDISAEAIARRDGAVVVDTDADLAALWSEIDAHRRSAQRTRGALSQLERSGALASVERARGQSDVQVSA